MAKPVAECGYPVNLAATAAVTPAPCQFIGFYVNSTSGGTLVLRDGGTAAAGGVQISGTITPVIGFHPFPASIGKSLHATIAVAALNVTFFAAAAN